MLSVLSCEPPVVMNVTVIMVDDQLASARPAGLQPVHTGMITCVDVKGGMWKLVKLVCGASEAFQACICRMNYIIYDDQAGEEH